MPTINPYAYEIAKVINHQTAKGLKKYGASLQDNPLKLTALQVVEYALEEAADTIIYLCKVKEQLERGE